MKNLLIICLLFTAIGVKAQTVKGNKKAVNKWGCTSCDTLILKPGKPVLIFHNIPPVLSADEFQHVRQLKESDLSDESINYKFGLSALSNAQREWDELQIHFPKEKFNYKYLFKHTYLKVMNSTREVVNMLTLPDEYKGFVYWSGKAGDKVVKREEMYQLTELVAKHRKARFRSGYMIKHDQDSVAIAHYKTVFNPTRESAGQALFFAVNLNFKDYYLPLQLFNLKDVKEIKLTSDVSNYRNVILDFNNKGQVIKMLDALKAVSVEYKDGAPHLFTDGNVQFQEFSYSGDTVIVANKWDHKLDLYTRAGNFYFKTKSYLLYEPVRYRKELVLSQNDLILQADGSADLAVQAYNPNKDVLDMLTAPAVNEESRQTITHVSSVTGTLPLTIKYRVYYDSKFTVLTEEQYMDAKGNLILDKTVDGIRRRHLFKMKDGRPLSLTIKTQILSDDGKSVLSESKRFKPQVINFSYQYY
ncbi:hypothetical protein TH53_20965 [Pedobacter lusitanus]|uniref:Uncharacterized protein n=1 Tax=Pedobacter lusitanus TaxID=1503925 RepID=A0A0D0GDP1_9SPHI|nr:hypothetical protein [Pedobacter lusitanus]KIO75442.1 hypothetical protein TH53_20965 [Pedobacter lusitanus]